MFLKTKISCHEYLSYFNAVSNVEFYLANGIFGIEVKENGFVPIKRSFKSKLSSIFSQIGAFFSTYRRSIRQAQLNKKVDLLRQSISTINRIHGKCLKNQKEHAYQFHHKNAFFEHRLARLYLETLPRFNKLNKPAQKSSKIANWFKTRMGNLIKDPAGLKVNIVDYYLPPFPWISDTVLNIRKEIWKGNFRPEKKNAVLARFNTKGFLNVRPKLPLKNDTILKYYQMDLLDHWVLYRSLRKEKISREEFLEETKPLQPPAKKRLFGMDKDLEDYLSAQANAMDKI